MTQYQQVPARKPMSREARTGWAILIGFGVFLAGIGVGWSANQPADPAVAQAGAATTSTKPVRTGPVSVITADGVYLVGVDLVPGQYRSGDDSDCYWARLRNTAGDSDSIIANNNGGNQVVTISATDKAFETKRCGGWRKIG